MVASLLQEEANVNGTHYCRCCAGVRPNNGVVCLGCGTALISCERKQPARMSKVDCPCCAKRSPQVLIEPGRYRCTACNSIFEADDFSFFDDRPDVSLDKKERYERERKRRGRNR